MFKDFIQVGFGENVKGEVRHINHNYRNNIIDHVMVLEVFWYKVDFYAKNEASLFIINNIESKEIKLKKRTGVKIL